MEQRITSRRNPLLAHTKKLLTSRAYREKSGEFAADGVKLLDEAARWYPGLHTVIAEENVELCKLPDSVRIVRVPKDVMQSVSLMDAPQGAIFLCRLPEKKTAALVPGTLLLDGVGIPVISARSSVQQTHWRSRSFCWMAAPTHITPRQSAPPWARCSARSRSA